MMKWLFGKFFFFKDTIIRDHFRYQFHLVFWVDSSDLGVLFLPVLGAGL